MTPDQPAPLTPDQAAAVERAREEAALIFRAVRVSTTTVWTVGLFGGLTVLWGLVAGAGGLVVGVALLAVAWNERRGRDGLRRFDPDAPRILGWNQVVLAAVITAYALLAILRAWTRPDPSLQELEELVGFDPDTVASLTTVVYGTVIVLVDAAQAALARFHFRRGPMVARLRSHTPAWVLDLLR